jgi:hypothetical protein
MPLPTKQRKTKIITAKFWLWKTFRALCGTYTVILYELKVVLKASGQVKQTNSGNKATQKSGDERCTPMEKPPTNERKQFQ